MGALQESLTMGVLSKCAPWTVGKWPTGTLAAKNSQKSRYDYSFAVESQGCDEGCKVQTQYGGGGGGWGFQDLVDSHQSCHNHIHSHGWHEQEGKEREQHRDRV